MAFMIRKGETTGDCRRRSKTLLLLVTVLFWFAQSSYTAFLYPMLRSMGASASLIGMVGGVYGFTQLVLRLPIGILADRNNMRKIFICLGALVSATSCIGFFIGYNPVIFLLCRALAGVASSTWACFAVLYGSYFPDERSTSAVSLLTSANYFGALTGMILAGLTAEWLGERYVFLLASIAAVTALLLSFLVTNTHAAAYSESLRWVLRLFRDQHLLKTSVLAAMVQIILCATVNGFTAIIARELGAQGFALSLMSVCANVCMIATSVIAGKVLINRYRISSLVRVGFAALAVYCFLVPFARSLLFLYALQSLGGAGNGLVLPLLNGWCNKEIARERKTAAMSLYQAIYGLGMTLGPLLFGILADGLGLAVSYRVMTLLAVSSACFIGVLFKGEVK